MKKVVTIGGGTGNFVVLRGLRGHSVELSAIVSMADDGGSTGRLRDELGVLPPGDVRQCLVALSESSLLLRRLMNYRFENGGLEGHSFGNLMLSALEKVTGSFQKAVEEVGKILSIKGKVVPVTMNPVRLKMILKDCSVLHGEREVDCAKCIDKGYSSLFLDPHPKASQGAIDEILNADVIVLGPGSLYTSIIPNLLVDGVSKAIRDSAAKKVFVGNLVWKQGQTTNFKVSDYLKEVVRYLGEDVFDYIVVNVKEPSKELKEKYAAEGGIVVNDINDKRVISGDLVAEGEFIRHDSKKLAEVLMGVVNAADF